MSLSDNDNSLLTALVGMLSGGVAIKLVEGVFKRFGDSAQVTLEREQSLEKAQVALREELREEIKRLREELRLVEAALRESRQGWYEVQNKFQLLQVDLDRSRNENEKLRNEITSLKEMLTKLQGRLDKEI